MHFFGFHSFSVFIAFETKKILKIMKKSSSAADQLTITFATNSSPNHKFIQTCVVWRNLVALHENTALDEGGEGVEVDLQVIFVQNPQFSKRSFVQNFIVQKYQCMKPKTSIIIMVEKIQNQKSSFLS